MGPPAPNAELPLDDLPRCPTRGVTFNKPPRRREPIPWDKLPSWRRRVDGSQSPMRCDDNVIIYPRSDGGVLPSRNMGGQVMHVQQTKEARYVGDRTPSWFPSAPRPRDTFGSAAPEAGVDPLNLNVPMNHAPPLAGDVTKRRIRPGAGHLGGKFEKVAAFLVERMGNAE